MRRLKYGMEGFLYTEVMVGLSVNEMKARINKRVHDIGHVKLFQGKNFGG